MTAEVFNIMGDRNHLVLMIYGSTGSGKSTFLKALLPTLQFPGGLYLIAPFFKEDFGDLENIEGYILREEFMPEEIDDWRATPVFDDNGEKMRRLFIIDDAMRFQFSEKQNARAYMDSFISDARHQDISIIMCLQMLKGAPPSIRSQATDLIATRVDKPLLPVLELMLPTDLSILSTKEKLQTLKPERKYTYLYCNNEGKCTHVKLALVYDKDK